MLDDVVRFLTCPHCGESLARESSSRPRGPDLAGPGGVVAGPGGAGRAPSDAVVRCRTGHAFDVARQGYVSLLPGGATGPGGDTAAMVRARGDFLAAGHFGHLAAELARTAAEAADRVTGDACVVDMGAGTGYYLAAVLDSLPGRAGLALDASKFALRRAARAHPRIGAAACDVWRAVPVADGAAAVILNVFAPRNGAQAARILAPAGRLLVITPTPLHMAELVRPLGLLTVDRHKEGRLSRTLDPYFVRTEKRDIARTVILDQTGTMAAVMMGPSAWQADPAACQAAIRELPEPLEVTLSVTLSCYARSDP